jgi:hypothetical protein
MALLHEVGHQLLSKYHYIVRLNLEGHSTLTELSIDQEFAPFILKSVFFLQEILGYGLNFLFEKSSELVKVRIHNHFNNFVFIQLVVLLEDVGLLFFFLI